jgi:thioredoxin 1
MICKKNRLDWLNYGDYYTPPFSKKQGFPHGDFVTEGLRKTGYTVVTKKNKEDYNMSAVNIDLNNFHQEVMNSDKPVLLDFWAPWCGPCRMVVPMVEAIAEERPDIKVGKINIDEQYELANQFGIMSIPTLMVLRDGKVVRKAMGARPKQAILELLQ